MLYNYMVPGGVRYDMPDGQLGRATCSSSSPCSRTRSSPTTTPCSATTRSSSSAPPTWASSTGRRACDYGCTGPVLRGSGVKWDCRKDDPYSLYHKFDFEIPVGTGEMGTVGDCWDRYIVRVREIEQSCRIIRQALEPLPDGPVPGHRAEEARARRPPARPTRASRAPRASWATTSSPTAARAAFRNKVRSPLLLQPAGGREGRASARWSRTSWPLVGSLDIVLGEIDR